MKAGIIRCQQTEDLCPGSTDFVVAANGRGAFAETGPVEITGFITCGGCPGKRVLSRAQLLISHGAEIIVLASCISRGNPQGFPCPHVQQIMEMLRAKLPETILLLDWTH